MGNRSGSCLPLLLCVHTFVWFVFRFPADTELPFLSSAELAVALLAGRQAAAWWGGRSQVSLKQMVEPCTLLNSFRLSRLSCLASAYNSLANSDFILGSLRRKDYRGLGDLPSGNRGRRLRQVC